ncbi:hypothetical protein E8E14_011967 [Neopestalotiopsis sp. 37M]|nr:hypothetical protein E8E14_011967 [Neopestalotiopsis sp. 37M]
METSEDGVADGVESDPVQDLTKGIIQRVLEELRSTPYACESLALIPSGTTNFVFRGTLKHVHTAKDPDENIVDAREEVRTLIVKVVEGFARLNPAIKIDGRRGPFESFMFGVLNDFEVPDLPISVRPPHLLYVGQAKNTFVVEDFGTDCVTLAEYLERAKEPEQLKLAGQFMKHLGAWLRDFHEWTLQDGQAGLRETMRISNEESGRFKRDIMYGNMALSGNPDLSVVDWEFAHLGPRAYDVGQMIGDLVEKYELSGINIFCHAIDQFVEGYGVMSKEMAFRVRVHAGVQLINWYIRGPKEGLSDEEICRIVKLGRDMVCHGMNEDEKWFHDNKLGRILLATRKTAS